MIMTKRLRFILQISILLSVVLLTACESEKIDITFASEECRDSVLMIPSNPKESPVCTASIQLTYLEAEPGSKHLNAVEKINRYIIDQLLPFSEGADVKSAPRAYVDAMLKDFTTNVKSTYYEDLDFFEENNSESDEDFELMKETFIAAHSYEYEITSEAHMGFADSLVCYTLMTYTYLGGAHPMTTARTVTFSLTTGQAVKPSDIFLPGTEDVLIDRLTKRLMEMANVKTIEELHEVGFLDLADMFVSENMLLEKDRISFHYDPYDIAPYALGAIDIDFTYKELEDLMV